MVKHWLTLGCLMLFGIGTNVRPTVCGLLQDVATLCPYNNFCNSNATKIRTQEEMHLTPCCRKCSCAEDCQQLDYCCPDMKPMQSVKQKYPCVDLNQYYNEPRGLSNLVDGGYNLHYRIVDTCPNRALDRAYPRCSILEKLDDCILVSDPFTGHLYTNKHCAMCNGVNQNGLIEWNLITDCNPYSDYLTLEDWHEHIMRHCSLIPYPPNPTVGQLVRCHTNVRSRCNTTGNWDIYNQDVKDACELGNDNVNNIYTHEEGRVTSYYQNVYCYMCNTRHDQQLHGLCENTDYNKRRLTTIELSVLINFQAPSTGDKKKTKRCHSTQMWNPFNGSCMAVRCPFTTYAHNGKCEDLYSYFPNQKYMMIFRLTKSDDYYSNDLLIFLNRTVASLLANADCKHWQTTLNLDSNSNFFLTYELTSTGSCTEYFIVSKMKNILKFSPINLRVGETTKITLVPELRNEPILLWSYIAPLNTGPVSFTDPIVLTWLKVDKCPRIPLASLGFNQTTVIKTERNGTICVDEYFRIMTSMNTCVTIVPFYCMTFMLAIISAA